MADTSQEAYSKIKKDAERVKQYLLNNGISEEEIVFNSVDIGRTYKQLYDTNGNYVGSEEDGYQLTQGVIITSSNLDNVEKNTGASLGKLKNSNLGVFQITAKNSGTSSYSYDGAFDTSSRHKTATITVKLEYDIK